MANSSGNRVHPSHARNKYKAYSQSVRPIEAGVTKALDAIGDSIVPVAVVKRSNELKKQVNDYLLDPVKNTVSKIEGTVNKVNDAIKHLPETIADGIENVKNDAVSYMNNNFDMDQLASSINDWYEGIQTGDETANELAGQNATDANAFSKEEARLAREWNEQMYNTRYQRTYADMKAAGINPVIGLASMGVGAVPSASAPSGVSAQTFMRQPTLVDQVLPIVQLITSLVSAVTKAKR